MTDSRYWHLGELEDVRPCDGCGRDYVFLIGEDPGKCPACLRLERQLHEGVRAVNRQMRRRKEER